MDFVLSLKINILECSLTEKNNRVAKYVKFIHENFGRPDQQKFCPTKI